MQSVRQAVLGLGCAASVATALQHSSSSNRTVMHHDSHDNKPGGGIFQDVFENALPNEWQKWGRSGFPEDACGAPLFVDINGDGAPDFFHHNHYRKDPNTEWDVGLSPGKAALQNKGTRWADASGGNFDFTDSKKQYPLGLDSHGSVWLDLDNDGFNDLSVAIGGGDGIGEGDSYDSAIFWGEKASGRFPLKLKGGRAAAKVANINNHEARGRFIYYADCDKDGLLDMVLANDVRDDQKNTYGYALMNKGNRKFKKDAGLEDYLYTMILTDADGDGHAEELVGGRKHCVPWEIKPSQEIKNFCNSRPSNTLVVYKYNQNKGHFEILGEEKESEFGKQKITSMQSGDFDHDGKADLVVLRDQGLSFYYSGKRNKNQLPIGTPSQRIQWPLDECVGHGLRIADFDLDGQQDLLIMCEQSGKHRMYTQEIKAGGPLPAGHAENWKMVWKDLGDITNQWMALPSETFLKTQSGCKKGMDYQYQFMKDFCEPFLAGQDTKPLEVYGFGTHDWNNDGYTDVVVTHQHGRMLLLENNWAKYLDKPRKFIAVTLSGRVSNQYGIGATLVLTVSGMGPKKDQTIQQFREFNSAQHETDWWGSKDDRMIFGLGEEGVPEKLTVTWPGKGYRVSVIEKAQLTVQKHDMWNPLVVKEPLSK